MHNVLKKLYRDHATIAQLMFILERQLDGLKAIDRPDTNLLKDLIDFVSDYSDRIHHPIEDLLFQTLHARTDQGRKETEELLVQHLTIADMTRKFHNALQDIDKDTAISSLGEVEKKGREYIDIHRDHMQIEERHAFPLLNLALDSEDFDNASGALPTDEALLEDASMQERFPALAEYLKREKISL